ncbi:hypothetical protein AVEN_238130-1 [Araneus ventricosus]|uniref:Uncharacterized protein n=1 Tax=Araneus ventricosus TaxID=182803 RepID=A0A4Y2QG10_ARAVE|nr:hypothetical protein AVEN_238130-1 [Araneus ventricosus]
MFRLNKKSSAIERNTTFISDQNSCWHFHDSGFRGRVGKPISAWQKRKAEPIESGRKIWLRCCGHMESIDCLDINSALMSAVLITETGFLMVGLPLLAVHRWNGDCRIFTT